MSAVATFTTLSVPERVAEVLAEHPDREAPGVQLRRELDLGAFNAGVQRAAKAEARLFGEHAQTEPAADGHEIVYIVASGHATFTVDGEEVDAPAGTVVFIRDPAVRRSAVAKTEGTEVIYVGGRRGEAFRLPPGQAIAEFFPLHEAKDYEGAESVLREALAEYPGNALILYNLACCASLLGRKDEALDLLGDAIEKHPPFAENARDDADFDAVRGDKRFAELAAA